jgi:assimilatory nitrate reductase catalytic subunit
MRRALLAGQAASGAADDGPVVCACFGVGKLAIERAVAEGKLDSVEAIGRALRAGTNCGSCQPELARFVRAQKAKVSA